MHNLLVCGRCGGGLPSLKLLDAIPRGLTLSTMVCAVTAVSPHSCMAQVDATAQQPGQVVTSAAQSQDTLSLRRAKMDRSLTSSQLASALRPAYEKAHRGSQPWNIKMCREEILTLDEGAGGTAGSVLRKLKAAHALPVEYEMELIQGLAARLRDMGFGVALHVAGGEAVRCQVQPTLRQHVHTGTIHLLPVGCLRRSSLRGRDTMQWAANKAVNCRVFQRKVCLVILRLCLMRRCTWLAGHWYRST